MYIYKRILMYVTISGLVDPAAREALRFRVLQTYKMLTFNVGYFGLKSILQTEGSILDTSYDIWE